MNIPGGGYEMKSKTKEQLMLQAAHAHRQKDPLRSKTGLKKKEEALIMSQDRLLALVEMTSDWIWEIDTQGVYTYVSPKVTELLGYRAEEVLGKTPFDLMPAGEADRIALVIQPMLDNVQPINNLENINVHKDGHYVVLETSGVPILDAADKVVGYRGIDRDITDRKQMEERMKKSERRFRNLSEASLEAIVFIEDSIIVDANDALNRLFGYEGEDLSGRPATDFIVPERRPFTDERMRTRTTGIYETLGLRKDGSTFPIEVNPREFENDRKKLRISAVRDLTESKKIEKQLKDYQEHLEKLVEERTNELKKSEEKFRNIFENAQEGIFQSTPDGRLVSANPALASMFGSETPEELIELINDIPEQLYADPAQRLELVDILTHTGVVHDFEFQIRRNDGVIKFASMNARAVKDERGEILLYEGTIQDITEKKQAENALEVERQSLAEANTALKVLLKHREEDRKDLEEKLLANVQQLVMPYVEKLKKSTLDPVQQMSIGFIESNLNEIISPFLRTIQGFNFTPRQLEVATLVREGRTTKDIARILNMNERAVDIQRFLIRKKLGLNKAKTNLQAYLKSLV
jgi:PAS domain S-box-containing protein